MAIPTYDTYTGYAYNYANISLLLVSLLYIPIFDFVRAILFQMPRHGRLSIVMGYRYASVIFEYNL